MKLFIHKIDVFIDVMVNDTIHQEIVCFCKAITDSGNAGFNISCPFDKIFIIGSQSKVLTTHADGTPFISAITVQQMLQNVIRIDCNDAWLLWGGWCELINDMNTQNAKMLIDLHNKWSMTQCIKFALCTDMRFPFKKTYYLNNGRVDLVRPDFGKVLELTQCINKTTTIFADVKFLPLFMMPTYTNVKVQHRHIANKTVDLIYATRDYHMLSESRLNKLVRYYVDTEAKTSFMGVHKNVQCLFDKMNADQIELCKKNVSFDVGVSFYGVPYAMSYSIAHVAIGDAAYEKFGLIPNRVGEAVASNILSFIDNSIDENHILFANNSQLANMSYVNCANDVKFRLQWFKQNPDAYQSYCQMQIEHLKANFDLGKHFYAATYEFIATSHKNNHICDECYCKL